MADDFFTPSTEAPKGDDFFTPSGGAAPGAPPPPVAAPGFLANLQGRVTGEDPAAIAARGRGVASQLEAGPQTLPTAARAVGLPGVAKYLPGDYSLQQQLAAPGTASILGNTGIQAGIGAAEGAMKDKTLGGAAKGGAVGAATGAVTGLIGKGIREGVRAATNTSMYKNLSKQVSDTLAEHLGNAAPELKGLSAHDIAYIKGPEIVDKAWKSAKAQIPEGLVTEIPEELAKAAGLAAKAAAPPQIVGAQGQKLTPDMVAFLRAQAGGGAAAGAPGTVKVGVRDLVNALSDLEGPEKTAAWRAINGATEGIPALDAARNLNRIQAGWRELADKGKLFDGKSLRPEALRAAVEGKLYSNSLLSRGMQGMKDVAEKAVPEALTATKVPEWLRWAIPGTIGSSIGSLTGIPHGAVWGGLAGKAMLPFPKTIYGGLPAQPWEAAIPGIVKALNTASTGLTK